VGILRGRWIEKRVGLGQRDRPDAREAVGAARGTSIRCRVINVSYFTYPRLLLPRLWAWMKHIPNSITHCLDLFVYRVADLLTARRSKQNCQTYSDADSSEANHISDRVVLMAV
jgi:hypothetical protein